MSSTHMSPGKRKRSTAYARYAMSMNRRKGGATVAPTWTPWIVPVDCTRIVLQCGVVWCGVPKALLPKGKRPGCLPTGTGKRAGLCVLCARCV